MQFINLRYYTINLQTDYVYNIFNNIIKNIINAVRLQIYDVIAKTTI